MVQVVQIRCKLHLWGMLVQMVQQPPLGGCSIALPLHRLHLYFCASDKVHFALI